tara:strand:- start:1042 stop:1209 length:168 start_codon:yes stop_codon:yes gene_type:complete
MSEKKSETPKKSNCLCEKCDQMAVFIPPTQVKGKKLYVTYLCPQNHKTVKVLQLK